MDGRRAVNTHHTVRLFTLESTVLEFEWQQTAWSDWENNRDVTLSATHIMYVSWGGKKDFAGPRQALHSNLFPSFQEDPSSSSPLPHNYVGGTKIGSARGNKSINRPPNCLVYDDAGRFLNPAVSKAATCTGKRLDYAFRVRVGKKRTNVYIIDDNTMPQNLGFSPALVFFYYFYAFLQEMEIKFCPISP